MRRSLIYSLSVSMGCSAILSATPASAVSPAKWLELKEAGLQKQLTASYVSAESLYRLSIAEAKKLGPNSNELAESTERLAIVLVLQRNLAEAEPFYLKSMQLLEAKKREKTLEPELLVLLEELAGAYQSVSKHIKGGGVTTALEHALVIRTFISGDKHPEMTRNLRELVGSYAHDGRFAEARKHCTHLIRLDQEKEGNSKIVIANDFYVLAGIEMQLNNLDKAESYIRQALAISLKNPARAALGLHIQRLMLSQILMKKGELALAEQEARTGLAECEKLQGKDNLGCALNYVSLGDIKMKGRRNTDAVAQYLKALSIIEANCGPKNPQVLVALKPLKEAYSKTSPSKARQIQARISEIDASGDKRRN